MLVLIFLVIYGLVAFFKINRAKPVAWMVANVAFLAGAGLLCWTDQNLYCGVGVLAALGMVAYNMFIAKLPLLANKMEYVKMAVSNLLFWPVEVFEFFYGKLGAKISAWF